MISAPPRLAACLLACTALCTLATGCTRCGGGPASTPEPDPGLVVVPDGYGRRWRGQPVMRVEPEALVLPSGERCVPADPACPPKLEALRGERLAIRIERSLVVGSLSASLAAVAVTREAGEELCLLAADADSLRCIGFTAFGGEEFGAWLDAEKPVGKIRVVMRADGLEVVADRGKVPGPDRFGPSLPTLGGTPDFEGLDRLMRLMAKRFPDEEEAGLAPSPGTAVEQAIRVLAILNGPGGERFARTFLVYP